MSSTVFVNGVTLSDDDWFNDVNRLHYTIFGDPATLAAARNNLFALGSDADGDMYYRAASAVTRLAKGAANHKLFMDAAAGGPEWAAGIAIKSATYDTSSANGSVGYTGFGFKPSVVLIALATGNLGEFSVGISDGTTNGCVLDNTSDTDNQWATDAVVLKLVQSATIRLTAVVASLDADGFTLTYTKTGAKTGTATMKIIAFR